MEDFIDSETLAQALNIKIGTIRTWTRKKRIPNYKMGRLVRFKLGEVMAWMETCARAEVKERNAKK